MRALLVLGLVLATPAAGLAQDDDFLEAYRSTSQMFLGGVTDYDHYMVKQPALLLDGLDGIWYDIGNLFPNPASLTAMGKYEAGKVRQLCAEIGPTITVVNGFTAEFSHPMRDQAPVVTTYSARGGTVFGVYTATDEALRRHVIGDPAYAEANKIAGVLINANGVATLLRPHPDLLVVQMNHAMPRIYARCPD